MFREYPDFYEGRAIVEIENGLYLRPCIEIFNLFILYPNDVYIAVEREEIEFRNAKNVSELLLLLFAIREESVRVLFDRKPNEIRIDEVVEYFSRFKEILRARFLF